MFALIIASILGVVLGLMLVPNLEPVAALGSSSTGVSSLQAVIGEFLVFSTFVPSFLKNPAGQFVLAGCCLGSS